MAKIRISKKKLNENVQDNRPHIDANFKLDPITLGAMWDELTAQQTDKNSTQRKQEKKSTWKPVDISKLDNVKVKYADGSEDTISPARLAALTRSSIQALYRSPDTAALAKYFPKNIIWTFEIDTAATDGVRVFMNPAFADKLFSMDGVLANKIAATNPKEAAGLIGLHIQYVFIHEIYHQLYQHHRRAQLKKETANGKNHILANISMDVEINTAIESQLMQFQGCTDRIEGCIDDRFNGSTWEVIFDAYMSGQAAPPQANNQSNGGGQNPQQQNNGNQQSRQQGGQGSQSQGSSSSQNSNPGQQQSQNGQSNQNNSGNKPDFNNMSDSYKKGFAQAMQDIKSGKIAVANLITGDEDIDEAEYQRGYDDAVAMYRDLMNQQNYGSDNGDNMDGTPNEQTSSDSDNSEGEQSDSTEASNKSDDQDIIDGSNMSEATADNHAGFSGDLMDSATAQSLAEAAGQEYDMDDISQDPIQKADDFVRSNMDSLKKIGGKGHGAGGSLGEYLEKIQAMFVPKINWKKQLRKFMNSVVEQGVKYTYSRKKLGSTEKYMEPGKYTKPCMKTYYKDGGIAQVFHLIDGSGSMGNLKNKTFGQIFSEIIQMEKRTHIQHSACTYFSDVDIPAKAVSMWDERTSVDKVLRMLGTKTADGGTNIGRSIKSVAQLGAPYFSKREPHTLLLVYGDGDIYGDPIEEIPHSILKYTIFVIVSASEHVLENSKETLIQKGIAARNILCINEKDIVKK